MTLLDALDTRPTTKPNRTTGKKAPARPSTPRDSFEPGRQIAKILDRERGHHSSRDLFYGYLSLRCANFRLEGDHYLPKDERYTLRSHTERDAHRLRAHTLAFEEIDTILHDSVNAYPCDPLGVAYAELGLTSQKMGQCFTPPEVASMMTMMTLGGHDDIAKMIALARSERRRVAVSDPCAGGGVMMLATMHHIRSLGFEPIITFEMHLQDIDRACCQMSYIQACFAYAPVVVIWGDTIAMEQKEHWATPWYDPASLARVPRDAPIRRTRESDPAFALLAALGALLEA